MTLASDSAKSTAADATAKPAIAGLPANIVALTALVNAKTRAHAASRARRLSANARHVDLTRLEPVLPSLLRNRGDGLGARSGDARPCHVASDGDRTLASATGPTQAATTSDPATAAASWRS